jgi:xanthine/CO dehydrogenase XdhC/CoxF family maturation factor
LRETAEILELFTSANASGHKLVMATVVDVEGSSYRRPGAHLLLVDDGRKAGSISAGCLENDLIARGEQLFDSDRCALLQYDNDEFFGLNYGCDGTIFVLLQPLNSSAISFPQVFQKAQSTGKEFVLATVFECDEAKLIGTKILTQDRTILTSELAPAQENVMENGLPSALLKLVADEVAHTERRDNFSREFKNVALEDDARVSMKLFFETVKPSIRLVVFGAGDDVIPVLSVAQSIGMEVHIVDSRRSYLDRFEGTVPTHIYSDKFDSQTLFNAPGRTAALVMSHSFELDKRFLSCVLKNECAFAGVMGSRKRTGKLLAELGMESHSERITFPVGLDLGAETPEEIALSICSELLSFFKGTTSIPLSQVNGPIHRRADDVYAGARYE